MATHGKCAAVALILGGVAVAISGCGGGGGTPAPTPSPTPPATPTNTTTTFTTTTKPSLGGCSGHGGSGCDVQPPVTACFGLHGGQCMDWFKCGKLSPNECLKTNPENPSGGVPCGPLQSLDISTYSASFYNIARQGPGPTADVLTVPNAYYEDINILKANCAQPELLIAQMLDDGRRVFKKQNNGAAADTQCYHLTGHAGVHWLHLHTFLGSVPGKEHLPNTPPYAVCGPVSTDKMTLAKQLLGKVQ